MGKYGGYGSVPVWQIYLTRTERKLSQSSNYDYTFGKGRTMTALSEGGEIRFLSCITKFRIFHFGRLDLEIGEIEGDKIFSL